MKGAYVETLRTSWGGEVDFSSSSGDKAPEVEWLSLFEKSEVGKKSGFVVSLVCWITEPLVISEASERGAGCLQIGCLCAFSFV